MIWGSLLCRRGTNFTPPPPRIIKKTEGPRSDEIYQRPNFETYVDTWRYTLPWGVKIIVSTAAFKTYSYSKT